MQVEVKRVANDEIWQENGVRCISDWEMGYAGAKNTGYLKCSKAAVIGEWRKKATLAACRLQPLAAVIGLEKFWNSTWSFVASCLPWRSLSGSCRHVDALSWIIVHAKRATIRTLRACLYWTLGHIYDGWTVEINSSRLRRNQGGNKGKVRGARVLASGTST